MIIIRQCVSTVASRSHANAYMRVVDNRLNRYHVLKSLRLMYSSQAENPSSSDGLGIPEGVRDLVLKYAQKPQTSVSLQTLMRTGVGEMLAHKNFRNSQETEVEPTAATERILMQVAGFIRHEMPIRLAHRIIDLDQVPLMKDMPSVQAVKDIYISSFVSLVNEPKIHTPKSEKEFARKLEALYERHSNVLVQMARGAYELRKSIRSGDITGSNSKDGMEFEKMNECHDFLDRFYMSRIGIRILAGQYLALRGPPIKDYIGLICQHTSPFAIVQHAVDDATFMCNRKFGDAPEVIISGRMDLTFAYVPTHLHYILLELLKNALRATVEHHGIDREWPPIEVIIADGQSNEDVVIKISDKGGGIARSDTKKIWSYLFTTADPAIQEGMIAFDNDKDHSIDAPLAGLGYGLPISRSYARYFGGDLSVISMECYGTDAFVHMKRLGNSREPLPA